MYHTFDLSHIILLNVMMAWYFWGPRPPLDQLWEGAPLCVKGWDKKCKFASWAAGHNPRPCPKRPGHVWVTPSWWRMAPLGNPLAPCLCFLAPSFTPYNNWGKASKLFTGTKPSFCEISNVIFRSILVSSDRGPYSEDSLLYIQQLFQIFIQSINAIDFKSVTLSRLNRINAIDVKRLTWEYRTSIGPLCIATLP